MLQTDRKGRPASKRFTDRPICFYGRPVGVRLLLLQFVFLSLAAGLHADQPPELFRRYCFDCHGEGSQEANIDLSSVLASDPIDAVRIFENLATGEMPPADADQPTKDETDAMLAWLASRQAGESVPSFRRLGRREFVHSVNDLLGIELDVWKNIPADRGTRDFDSDRRIRLSREILAAYFAVADQMLDHAFPRDGFAAEQTWVTNKLMDSHHTYNIYVRDYEEGVLFSWTRANNGNSYSFFYDNFDPPEPGWYELTFDAAKVGDFKEDVSIQVHAGKYYFADDRPQPQRLLKVLSVGERELRPYRVRVFLNPGENVSVHCYSKHTFRSKSPEQGAYIKQLTARGPLQRQWPPTSYRLAFDGVSIDAPPRGTLTQIGFQSSLQRIGGTLSVSSFQNGMEKGRMQDGSNKTFWHTRFAPTVATPPHFVVLENPRGVEIEGLSYATWSGGNGNGQVKKYSIYFSEDGKTWGEPIVDGDLEVRLANEQPIPFPEKTTKRFIKFLVQDAVSLDGKSLASVGKLDVIVADKSESDRTKVTVAVESAESEAKLRRVLQRFAERAFATRLSDDELLPYYQVALLQRGEGGDFVQAAKAGFKAIVCSPRFLMVPGEHESPAFAKAADLARILWLSVPDADLFESADLEEFSEGEIRSQIDRMIRNKKFDRMVESFCDQWLNLRTWDNVSPSLKLYPMYDDLLDHYLPIETTSYLAHLIRENEPASHLIDSDYSFLNQRLAQHYEIDGVFGQQVRKVSFAPDSPRGGLLTMGSVLKVTTDGFGTSPILRGAWISKNIIGTPLSPPPESVKAIEPQHGDSATTLREQIDQHKTNTACYSCHKNIDPYGFALESFDATGQWRTKYRVRKPHKGTFQFRLQGHYRLAGEVDAAGDIDGQTFESIVGLKKILLSNERRIAYNFAKKFFEYASGDEPTLRQRVALLGMLQERVGETRMKDLLTDVLIYALRGENG